MSEAVGTWLGGSWSLFLLVLVLGTACTPSEGENGDTSPPSIENCLAEGRSLGFEAAVRKRFREDFQSANQSVPPFGMDAGAVRIVHSNGSLYAYEAEYRLTFPGGVLDILATGTVEAETCSAQVVDLRL